MKAMVWNLTLGVCTVVLTVAFFLVVVPLRCIIMLVWLFSEFVWGGIERIADRFSFPGFDDNMRQESRGGV
jgi:hypothetical protein